MDIFSKLLDFLYLLIILSILVVAHEWGHFIMARLFKIGVEDFSVGMGPRLLRLGKRGDTEYNIRAFPLGGFVKIQGMEADDESINIVKDKLKKSGRADDADASEIPLVAENRDSGLPTSDPDGFNSRPLYQRTLVILGGPVMSFLLGWLLLIFMGCTVGVPTGKVTNRVYQVLPGGAGQQIGLEAGDVIEKINGSVVTDGAQLVDIIHHSLGKELKLSIRKNNVVTEKVAIPQELKDEDGKPIKVVDIDNPVGLAAIGAQKGDTVAGVNEEPVATPEELQKTLVAQAGKPITLDVARNGEDITLKGTVPAGIAESLPKTHGWTYAGLSFQPAPKIEHVGFRQSVRLGNLGLTNVFKMLWHLIKIHKLQKNAGGIVKMYQATHIAAKNGLPELVSLAAQISISLAIFNMLPIPILDGGHLLSFFVEWIRHGKRLTLQQQQVFLVTGLFIIGALVILINGHDILNTLKGQIPQ